MDIYGEREVLCFFTSCLVLLVVTDTGNLQKKMPLQCQVCWSPIVETGFALTCGHVFHYDYAKCTVEGTGRCALRCTINRQDEFLKMILREFDGSLPEEIQNLEVLNGLQKARIEELQCMLHSLIDDRNELSDKLLVAQKQITSLKEEIKSLKDCWRNKIIIPVAKLSAGEIQKSQMRTEKDDSCSSAVSKKTRPSKILKLIKEIRREERFLRRSSKRRNGRSIKHVHERMKSENLEKTDRKATNNDIIQYKSCLDMPDI